MFSFPTGADSLSKNAFFSWTPQVFSVTGQSHCSKQGHWFLLNRISALKDTHLSNEFINLKCIYFLFVKENI